MEKELMKPTEVAQSAERQLFNLTKAQNDKMQELLNQREYVTSLKRVIQALIYAAGTTYQTVFPGASGFIEGRIKSIDSVTTKTKNEFTEILNKIEENPNIDQKSILDEISKISFKDIVAFSVITTTPPKKFRTGSDELNEKLNGLAEELEITSNRLSEHKEYIERKERTILDLTNRINALKAKTEDEHESNANNELLEEFKAFMETTLSSTKEDVEYGIKTLSRTNDTYMKSLRELQYKMSAYFVSNLSKFSSFKFWGTQEVTKPKTIEKPGFKATNTGYKVKFSNEKSSYEIKFEAQGKGGLDYQDAEFSYVGASYHEEQKTKDGLISKKTDMPDFTIIGAEHTKRIEREVRLEYQDINSLEDLKEKEPEEYDKFKMYEDQLNEELQSKFGDNLLTKGKVKEKIKSEFDSLKENLIQRKTEDRINHEIDIFSDSDFVKNKIKNSEELTKIYEQELERLKVANKNQTDKIDKKDREHIARKRVVYYAKEKEVTEYAKAAVPMFFRANLQPNEEVMVYWFSTGESLYRYFYNKLNGLKDENGKYKYEPQEQQKNALLRLTGLFEEDCSNFYTYNKNKETFGGLER